MSVTKNLEEAISSIPMSGQTSTESATESTAAIAHPPTDLYSDEPPLESHLHLQQMMLLISCLNWLWRDRQDYFATGNLTIFYNQDQLKTKDYRGPDFFVVLNTDPKPRKSWTIWQEGGKYPNVIIELLSPSTAHIDRGIKKDIYQDIFRTPDYFWFDPNSLEFKGFHLLDGRYEELEPSDRDWLWSQQLQLFLGVLEGKLRFFTPDGNLVLSPEEANARLVAKLQELGVDPNAT